jgi:hypothetical protein
MSHELTLIQRAERWHGRSAEARGAAGLFYPANQEFRSPRGPGATARCWWALSPWERGNRAGVLIGAWAHPNRRSRGVVLPEEARIEYWARETGSGERGGCRGRSEGFRRFLNVILRDLAA